MAKKAPARAQTKRAAKSAPGKAAKPPRKGAKAAKRAAKPKKAAPPALRPVQPLVPLAPPGRDAPPSGSVPDALPGTAPGAQVLDRLWSVVLSRREADPAVSHSARLLSRGSAKVAQKFGEEAVECLIEAVAGNRAALVAESADVLYHLLVLWVDAGVLPREVWGELERREGVSGVAEKASRRPALATGLGTTKIP